MCLILLCSFRLVQRITALQQAASPAEQSNINKREGKKRICQRQLIFS